MTSITTRIEAITANARKFAEKKDAYDKSARNLTWSIVAEVYALGLEALDPANEVDYDRELNAHGLKPAQPGENPWLKVLNVAVGHFYINADDKRAWKPNASFSKYARALRFMESQGVTAADALAYIKDKREYVTDNKGRHLIGMIEADKVVHPPQKRDNTDPNAIKKALDREPLGVVELPETDGSMPRYARAYGEIRDGKFVVVGLISDSEDAAKSDLNKAGKALTVKVAV